MTPKERAAMQQALEALELSLDRLFMSGFGRSIEKAITALREALAEPVRQQPYGTTANLKCGGSKWVDLTPEAIECAVKSALASAGFGPLAVESFYSRSTINDTAIHGVISAFKEANAKAIQEALELLEAPGRWECAGSMPPEVEERKKAALGLAPWLSAALDDDKVCPEYKKDINAWFDAAMPEAPSLPASQESVVTSMVNRFLGWKLPEDFVPDAGISFDRKYGEKWGMPVGTNLFTAEQVKAMFEYCLKAVENTPSERRVWPTMGYGSVAIGVGIQPNGTACLLYLDMGETREIDADTTDLFPVGSEVDPAKVMACVFFKDGAAIQQTIDVLREMQADIGYSAPVKPVEQGPEVAPESTPAWRHIYSRSRG